MPKMSEAEKAFKKEHNGGGLDTAELVDEAAKLDGPLGDAARAVKATMKLFERELERINFEVG